MPRRNLKLTKEYQIESEPIEREVVCFGTGGHIIISKGFIGKKVIVGVLKK